MANWKYADHLPTSPWRGQMTFPRTLGLIQTDDGIRLTQTPIREIEALRGGHVQLRNASFADAEARLARQGPSETLEIIAELKLNGTEDAGFELRKGSSARTLVGYDARKRVVYIDRTRSGGPSISPEIAARHEAPLAIQNGRIQLHILLDKLSVEVFADGGRVALTDLIFPNASDRGLGFYSSGKPPEAVSLDLWELKSRR
jgi:fructan beta-fructosidase